MLSVRHDKSKAGQPTAALSPPPQLAAARAALRGGVAPSAPARGVTARVIAFPGAASRSAIPLAEARTRWPAQPARRTPDRTLPAVLHAAPADTARCLTIADRIALLEWGSQGSSGYARVLLEEGIPGAAPDCGGYVLLYRQRDCWATLGLTRHGGGILVWRCSDGAACATYPTMAAALAALPPAAKAS